MPQMKNYDVELDGKLQNYFLETPKDKDISVLTDMLELEIAPPSVMYPLLSDVFLSPLNSFLKNVNCEPKGITALVGKTGTRKSTLSALMCELSVLNSWFHMGISVLVPYRYLLEIPRIV